MENVPYKSLFEKYRDSLLIDRWNQFAFWTISYLVNDSRSIAQDGRAHVSRDFQAVGSMLVSNLAAKLARLLFPVSVPFFKASASKSFKKWAKEHGITEEELTSQFALLEILSKDRLLQNSGYASLILALKLLIVTGNALIHRDQEKGSLTTWSPDCFATRRDSRGRLMDCILREFSTLDALPEELRVHFNQLERYKDPETAVEIYTRIKRVTRGSTQGFEVSQECDDHRVGESSWYPEALCPWMVPTWVLIPGEHHGRGLVEEYAADFARLSSLSEAAALYGVEMTRVLHLVGPSSGGDIDELTNAANGEFVRGDQGAISAYEAGDAGKLQQLGAEIDRVILRLSKSFMYTAQARQAERVTAYELQQEATEAEHGLGGAISTLSGGMQVPLAFLLMTEVSTEAMTGIVTGEIMPDVTTGIPALGRSSDVQNLIQAAQEIAGVVPVAGLDKRLNPARIIDIILAGRSIDPKTVFFTPEEQQQNDEAAQAQAQAQQSLIAAQTLGQQGEQLAKIQGA